MDFRTISVYFIFLKKPHAKNIERKQNHSTFVYFAMSVNITAILFIAQSAILFIAQFCSEIQIQFNYCYAKPVENECCC